MSSAVESSAVKAHASGTAKPDFNNILKVLRREAPSRPTLFELFLNKPLYLKLAGPGHSFGDDGGQVQPASWRVLIKAFAAAGYDYASVRGSSFYFPTGNRDHGQSSVSMNEGAVIHDRASFEAYPWPDMDKIDYSGLTEVEPDLPEGMKLIVRGPCGVLENVMSLVGYEAACFMIADDPALAHDIFEAIGSRLVRHYENACRHKSVGACVSNDDWGFKTQPMFSPAAMREFVFPWHKRIVEAIHKSGRPAILHSCGNLASVMDDIIDDLKYDGKHSYEDVIMPVEEAYARYGSRIAILGGLDLDFVCRQTPEAVRTRAKAMLEQAPRGYALGTGNSVPEYVPNKNYFAMTRAAVEGRGLSLSEE
jgi:uroporphyrinogen decarboxylase